MNTTTVADVLNKVNTEAELEAICDKAIQNYTIAKNAGQDDIAMFWAEVKRNAADKMGRILRGEVS